MVQTALVTGADRGLGLGLCGGLLKLGWRVFAGQFLPDWPDLAGLRQQFPDRLTPVALDVGNDDSVRTAAQGVGALTGSLDLLINNAGITAPSNYLAIREPQNYADMLRILSVNALGALRVVEAFLPLLDAGALKRLCFVSSEAGSVGASKRTGWFGYCMSKAALNMAVKNLHNELYPQGYTFRLYHPGWMRSYMAGVKSERGDMEPEEAAEKALPILLANRADEARLVLVDFRNQEWPW
jgi:NAD(P)-dependent dehydrogenase (short-subunit alcohol dehydrogenase family)